MGRNDGDVKNPICTPNTLNVNVPRHATATMSAITQQVYLYKRILLYECCETNQINYFRTVENYCGFAQTFTYRFETVK